MFAIALTSEFQKNQNEEVKIFLQRQREPGRPDYLAGVDKKLTENEEIEIQSNRRKEKRRIKYMSSASTSSVSYDISLPKELDDTSSSSYSHSQEEFSSTVSKIAQS